MEADFDDNLVEDLGELRAFEHTSGLRVLGLAGNPVVQ